MSYAVVQTRRFGRQYKKLHDNVVADVDEAVSIVADNPEAGARKKSDLIALRVFKFRSLGQLYLLGYTVDEAVRLVPAVDVTLESAVEFIDDDELVEITPKSIRMRKRHLIEHERRRASRSEG